MYTKTSSHANSIPLKD